MKREPYAWRVYYAPQSTVTGYCGQFDSYKKAASWAELEPPYSRRCDWQSYRAAQGQSALLAPPLEGVESDVATSWHGQSGWYCVVPVYQEDPQ